MVRTALLAACSFSSFFTRGVLRGVRNMTVATFSLERLLDLCFFLKSLAIRRSKVSASAVSNLTAAEDHGALHLVARLEEALGLADPHVVVMLIDLVAHLDLLDFGLVRLLGLLAFFSCSNLNLP